MDLEESDKNTFWDESKRNPSLTIEEFMTTKSLTNRFRKAFESVFDSLRYVGKFNDQNTIYFQKEGVNIPIDQLSTGEMQIIFRGTDLLCHNQNSQVVLIDEPELSLHPMWQTKILPFYRSLFTNENGEQIAQIIIATHSEYVIQSGVNDPNNIKICILSKDNGKILANKMQDALLRNCSAEINYLAFHVDALSYHIQLFAATHNIAKEKIDGVGDSIKSFDRFIISCQEYDSSVHAKPYTYERPTPNGRSTTTNYQTLPVYVRNAVDHPNPSTLPSEEEIRISLNLLRNIYKRIK